MKHKIIVKTKKSPKIHKKEYQHISDHQRNEIIAFINTNKSMSFRQASEIMGVGYSNLRKIYKIY